MKKVILMSVLLSLAIMSCKKKEETNPQNDALSENAVGKYFTSAGATGTPIAAKLLGGITKTTNHKGAVDAAWQFDGVDDRIEIADDAKFKPAAFTIAMRVFGEDIESRIGAFAYKGDADNSDYFLASEVNAVISVSSDGGNLSSQTSSTSGLKNNTWYHLTATADSDSIKLYIDGVKKASKATKFNIRRSVSPLFLGYFAGDGRYFFKGKMTDVAFYGTVLTDAEILNISK